MEKPFTLQDETKLGMKDYAVITGDIVNFTKLPPAPRRVLIDETEKMLKRWVTKPGDAEVFRGDSFQYIMDDINAAIKKSVTLICWFKQNSDTKNGIYLSARISAGIGDVSYHGTTVLSSDGDAFHRSGRNFDKMDHEDALSISTDNEDINRHIEIILLYINLIMSQWTPAQAQVIYLVCKRYTQTKMAQELRISQSSVTGRLKAARWKEVEKGINYIIKLATK